MFDNSLNKISQLIILNLSYPVSQSNNSVNRWKNTVNRKPSSIVQQPNEWISNGQRTKTPTESNR